VPDTKVARTTDLGDGSLVGATRGEGIGVGGLSGRGDVLMVDGDARPAHAHYEPSLGARGHGDRFPDGDRGGVDRARGTTVSHHGDARVASSRGTTRTTRPFARNDHPPFGGRRLRMAGKAMGTPVGASNRPL
jgi:hypothetical protein